MREGFIKDLKRYAARGMMLVATVLGCAACEDAIFDEEGDCDPHNYVRFVYDMNMLRADAFYSQVGSVDLYVFDAETGEYVTHLADKGEALTSGSYRMPLDLAPGKYEFVTWAGLADNDGDFTVPTVITQPEDMICTMARSRNASGAYSNRNLHALFHGTLSTELPDEAGEHVVTVKLMKNTNNINLSLNHTGGPLDPNRFEVTMTDENGLMAYDNSLMADETIEYRPWSLRGGSVDLNDGEEGGFLVAELSTARLMADHESRINIVDKQTGKTVFSIPIVQWALLLRSANHASMGDQEYLDREDEYNLMVFLTNAPTKEPDDPTPPVPDDPTPPEPDDPTPPVPDDPTPPVPDDPTPPVPDDPTPPAPDDPEEPEDPTPTPPSEEWTAVSIIINGWHFIFNNDVEL